ncbi:hypothetical protein niasHS_004419 [Heterodera schachtii]|uniref:Uncharacterized protein n=1 Tax=Heterodera schachtii TaxID=97005 RepID=A0ABD2K0N3_HETSC
MPSKICFVPVKEGSTAFFYPTRGTQRERSPSPCGGVRVTPSPERLARPSGVVVPENTDLSVFQKAIPGRDWDEDRRKRNELLCAYSFGHDARIAANLRRLIEEMKVFAEEAKKNVDHSRGLGIAVQGKVRDPWPFTRFDAWLSAGKNKEVQRKGLEGMYLNAHFDRKLSRKERNQRILSQRCGPIIGLAPPVAAKALKIVAEKIFTPIGYSPSVPKPALRSVQSHVAEPIKKMANVPWKTSNGWIGINLIEKEFENYPELLCIRLGTRAKLNRN